MQSIVNFEVFRYYALAVLCKRASLYPTKLQVPWKAQNMINSNMYMIVDFPNRPAFYFDNLLESSFLLLANQAKCGPSYQIYKDVTVLQLLSYFSLLLAGYDKFEL